ncbi:EF-hand domain-containing protein [Burkholderia stabilis]|uniref:EF-hand domain-containing protein n=1 Tax=Burkholderia stabilis TaxID=95485 RepID=A0A4Q2ADC9_9BURK|nr:EF-hand domain-containing protein [Burkholderia stabilis]RXV67706.1 EF-hand domain-containing protein [Burkholderia stabilis]
MKSIKKMIAVVVLCIVSAAASAQQVPPGAANGGARVEHALMQLQTRFASANTTHDGKLTREQAAAGMPMVAQHFDEIDAQRNGYVMLAQIASFMRQRMAAR